MALEFSALHCKRCSQKNECMKSLIFQVGEMPNQPKIDLSCAKDIRVRAGEDFSVNINYTGFPVPTAEFWNGDLKLTSDSRVHIQAKLHRQ